jgi:hypothetical protein
LNNNALWIQSHFEDTNHPIIIPQSHFLSYGWIHRDENPYVTRLSQQEFAEDVAENFRGASAKTMAIPDFMGLNHLRTRHIYIYTYHLVMTNIAMV